MEYIKKYFSTENEALEYIDKINKLLNIPSSPDAIGQTYAEPLYENEQWYILCEETLLSL